MESVVVPGCLDTAARMSREHSLTIAAAAAVQLLLLGVVVGLGPLPVSSIAVLAYLSIEVATLLVEVGWVWNPGSFTAESYAAMVGLAKLTVVSMVFYALIALLLLKNNVTGCFLLLVMCTGAREMGHQMLHYSKEADWKARAAGSFLGAFTVALALSAMLAYGYLLTSWALMQGRPSADQVLFALLGPVVRLFALLSAQRYLGRQLLDKGLLDALTLYADLSLGIHLAVDVPFMLALLIFSGTPAFVLALVVTGLTDIAYVHALMALQSPREEGPVVTFAQQRSASVFGALIGGAFHGAQESSALLPGPGRAVSTAVTASIGDKDCVRPIGPRVAGLLDEYQELNRRLKSAPRVWQFQELKAATSAHSLGEWCACFGAVLLLVILPGLRLATGLSVQGFVLRAVALVLVHSATDLLRVRELQLQLPDGPLPTSTTPLLSLAYRAAAAAVPATAILAAI